VYFTITAILPAAGWDKNKINNTSEQHLRIHHELTDLNNVRTVIYEYRCSKCSLNAQLSIPVL